MYTVYITVSWSEFDIVVGDSKVSYEKAMVYLHDALELLRSNAVKVQSIRIVNE